MKNLTRFSLIPLLALFITGCSEDPKASPPSSSPLDNVEWITPPTRSLTATELVGSVWEVDLSNAEGKNRSDRIYQYEFQADGKLVLNTRPVKESSDEPPSLFQALVKDQRGIWKVEGSEVALSIEMMGKMISDTIQIQGETLIYHGQKMTRVGEK